MKFRKANTESVSDHSNDNENNDISVGPKY